MTLSPGTRLGPYEILSPIGAGGMGEVYRARDTRLGREVAVKVLPAEFASDPERLRRFEQEARAAAALNHPNILVLHDLGTHEGSPYIVTELLEGESLRQRLLGGALSEDQAVEIGLHIAKGLAAAHEKGVVHRDLKPENLFVTQEGHVKILDFGLAKLLSDRAPETAVNAPSELVTETAREPLTQAGTVAGTLPYMSPEQALGEELDVRTDLFSLGVVLYEMATGKVPFDGETAAARIDGLLHKEPPSPARINPQVTAALERAIGKALEKDRKLRYQSAMDMAVDLARIQQQRDPAPSTAAAQGKAPPRAPSLAVLPFTNMSADPQNEYFCDGLSEELTNALSQVKELRMVARTSAFAFRGKAIDIREVGQRLNAAAVLEGSVRKSGQRLRITAQLINVEDGYHLWSGQFDREMKDIFEIQDEISLAITEQMKVSLLKGEREKILKRATEDHEAYDLYLKGRYFWNRRYEQGLQRALQYFQQAIEKDPNYALAYVGIADSFGILGVYAFMQPSQAYGRVRAAAEKALSLDPDLAEAYASLAWVTMWFDWDFKKAEALFLRAVQMRPDYSPAHLWYGNLLLALGRFEESVAEMRRGSELEPMEPAPEVHVGWALHMGRRYDEAIEALRKVMASDPAFSMAYAWQALNYFAKEMWSEAIPLARKFAELTLESNLGLGILGLVCGAAGRKDEALKILERMDQLSKERYVGHFFRAFVWIGIGDKSAALDCLKKACAERESMMVAIGAWCVFDGLRTEAEFQALLRDLSLPVEMPVSPPHPTGTPA